MRVPKYLKERKIIEKKVAKNERKQADFFKLLQDLEDQYRQRGLQAPTDQALGIK